MLIRWRSSRSGRSKRSGTLGQGQTQPVAAGLVSIALSQRTARSPSESGGVHCMGRILVPLATTRCASPEAHRGSRALFAAARAGSCCISQSFLQNVVQYTESHAFASEAIGGGLLFMFTTREGVQPFFERRGAGGRHLHVQEQAVLVDDGRLRVRLRRAHIDVSTDGVVKQVLSGFWYTDYYRTGAMTALFAIPLASLGFVQLADIVRSWCAKVARRRIIRSAGTCRWGIPVALDACVPVLPSCEADG